MSSCLGITPIGQDLVNIDLNDVYSVTELSQDIKQLFSLTPHFNDILLKGEISNLIKAASGHIYFSLKDKNCVIACVFLGTSKQKDAVT